MGGWRRRRREGKAICGKRESMKSGQQARKKQQEKVKVSQATRNHRGIPLLPSFPAPLPSPYWYPLLPSPYYSSPLTPPPPPLLHGMSQPNWFTGSKLHHYQLTYVIGVVAYGTLPMGIVCTVDFHGYYQRGVISASSVRCGRD